MVGDTEVDGTETRNAAPTPYRWGFLSATAVILALMVAGQVALPVAGRILDGDAGVVQTLAFVGFVIAGGTFVFLQRAAVKRFFRSMHVGVSLVTVSLIMVGVGVLVPQISNFEDPTERVPDVSDIPRDVFETYAAAPKRSSDEVFAPRPDDHPVLSGLSADQVTRLKKWKIEYAAFRWAEGFFVYHLLHIYGLGMPTGGLMPGVDERLDRFQDRYGTEERENREKQMRAAFSGRQKSEEIGQLIRTHEPAFRRAFQICTALDLNRAYKSNWFATLMALLFVGVAFNTFKTKFSQWFTLSKGGYVLVHMGVMALLAGGLWSKLKTDRGILHLELGEPPRDVYDGFFDRQKPRRMPFALGLDRFARRDWKTLEVGFFGEDFRSNLPTYTLWPGRTLKLDYVADERGGKRPRIQIEVLELHERAVVGPPRWWEAEDPADTRGMGPLAHLGVVDRAALAAQSQEGAHPAVGEQPLFLTPDPRLAQFLDPAWKFRLAVAYGDDVAAHRRMCAPADDGRIAWLSMRVAAAGDVDPLIVPVRLGETVAGPAGYSIKVVSASADLRYDPRTQSEILDPRPLAEQYPRSPGIIVEISRDGGGPPERRVVSEAFSAEEHKLQKGYAFPDLALLVEWERWTSPGPPRYVLSWGPGREPELLSEHAAAVRVKPGVALPLPGDTQIVPREFLHNVRFEKSIEFDASADFISGPHYDEHFYSRDPTGGILRVTTDPGTAEERAETIRVASTDASRANVWSPADRRFWLRYYENDEVFPFEWRSVLSAYEKDAEGRWRKVDAGPEREREIRVNDYFVHRGYRFFQTNADPRFPNYSGIGVVYDPGIPLVLFGMYLTIFGTLVAFVARPIAQARGRRRQGAA